MSFCFQEKANSNNKITFDVLLIREAHQNIQYWSSGLNQNYQIVLIDLDYCLGTKWSKLGIQTILGFTICSIVWTYLNNKKRQYFERLMAHVHLIYDSEKNFIKLFYYYFANNDKTAIWRTVWEPCGCVLNCTVLRLKMCTSVFSSRRFPASSKTGYDFGEREVRFFCSPRRHYLKPLRQNSKKQK